MRCKTKAAPCLALMLIFLGCGEGSPWNGDFGPCVPCPADMSTPAIKDACGVDYCQYDTAVRGYCCGRFNPRVDGGTRCAQTQSAMFLPVRIWAA